MDLYALIAFTAASALISLSIRSYSREIGRQTAAAAAVFAALSIINALGGVMDELRGLAELGGLGGEAFTIVLKAVGIAYLTRIASSICTDAGESTLAEAAGICGRLLLAALTLPVVRRVILLLIELINSGI